MQHPSHFEQFVPTVTLYWFSCIVPASFWSDLLRQRARQIHWPWRVWMDKPQVKIKYSTYNSLFNHIKWSVTHGFNVRPVMLRRLFELSSRNPARSVSKEWEEFYSICAWESRLNAMQNSFRCWKQVFVVQILYIHVINNLQDDGGEYSIRKNIELEKRKESDTSNCTHWRTCWAKLSGASTIRRRKARHSWTWIGLYLATSRWFEYWWKTQRWSRHLCIYGINGMLESQVILSMDQETY